MFIRLQCQNFYISADRKRGGKGPRQKNVKKCQKYISTLFVIFRAGQKRQKSSKKCQISTLFRQFRRSTIFWLLFWGSNFWGSLRDSSRASMKKGKSKSFYLRLRGSIGHSTRTSCPVALRSPSPTPSTDGSGTCTS